MFTVRDMSTKRSWVASALISAAFTVALVAGLLVPGLATTNAFAASAPSKASTSTGVTATSIKVGVLVTNLGAVSKVGASAPGFSTKTQEATYQAYFDAINSAGGISGRKVVPVFQSFDPLSTDSMQSACISLTEDQKVFAVLQVGGFYGPPELCITQTHGTLLLDGFGNDPDQFYQQSHGLLFTAMESQNRALAVSAQQTAKLGLLKGKSVGILNVANSSQQATTKGLIPALARVGVKKPVVRTLSADFGTAATQIPLAVNAMRTAGVSVVFLPVNEINASEFVQNANSQGFNPTYVASDNGGGATDVWGQSMPASFKAIATTSTRINEYRVNTPQPATDTSCVATYEAATKQQVTRSSSTYGGITATCAAVQMFKIGAAGAGKQLTRKSFSQALSRAAPFPLAGFGGTISFASQFDGATSFRNLKWSSGCKCWMPIGKFQKIPG
jgi:hypothetical protein